MQLYRGASLRFDKKEELKYSLERIRVLFEGQLELLIKNSLRK